MRVSEAYDVVLRGMRGIDRLMSINFDAAARYARTRVLRREREAR
jgi:hypothetical protein